MIHVDSEVALASARAVPVASRRWLFDIVRDVGGRRVAERVEVVARDSFSAFYELPDDVVEWDFARYDDGAYSQPIGEAA